MHACMKQIVHFVAVTLDPSIHVLHAMMTVYITLASSRLGLTLHPMYLLLLAVQRIPGAI